MRYTSVNCCVFLVSPVLCRLRVIVHIICLPIVDTCGTLSYLLCGWLVLFVKPRQESNNRIDAYEQINDLYLLFLLQFYTSPTLWYECTYHVFVADIILFWLAFEVWCSSVSFFTEFMILYNKTTYQTLSTVPAKCNIPRKVQAAILTFYMNKNYQHRWLKIFFSSNPVGICVRFICICVFVAVSGN